LFLGLINATKVPESDLFAYKKLFISVSLYPFKQYMGLYAREYIYYFYNYLSYNLLGGSWSLFILSTTFMSYFLLLKGISLSFTNVIWKQRRSIILALINVALFYPLFSLSAHLLRNFIAGAIIFYFGSNYFFKNKKLWWLLIIAGFIHSSSLFFLIVLFIPQKLNWNKLPKYFMIITLFVMIFIFISLLENSFKILNKTYVSERVIGFLNNNYVFVNERLYFFFLFGILAIYAFYKIIRQKQFWYVQSSLKSYSVLFLMVLITAIVSTFFIPLIGQRFLLYTYFLFTIFLSFLLIKKNNKNQLLKILITVTIITSFIYNLYNGVWKYAYVEKLLTSNLFSILF